MENKQACERLAEDFEQKLNLQDEEEKQLSGIKEVSDSQIIITRDPETNAKIINGYRVGCEIGKGSWSKVKLCDDVTSGKKFAMKKFHKTILKKKSKITRDESGTIFYKSQWQNVEEEIAILRGLKDERITNIHAILDHNAGAKLYVIIDLCEHGDVLKWSEKTLRFKHIDAMQNATQSELLAYVQRVTLDTVNALAYIHERKIIHRDIKPQNILITKDFRAKLCDFGLAVHLQPNQLMKGTEGTYHFMAPESLSDADSKLQGGFDGEKADIWSLGVTFYCIAFLRLPFYHDNIMQLFNTIQQKEAKYDSPLLESNTFIDLIQKMLVKSPAQRITLAEIKTHHFFTPE